MLCHALFNVITFLCKINVIQMEFFYFALFVEIIAKHNMIYFSTISCSSNFSHELDGGRVLIRRYVCACLYVFFELYVLQHCGILDGFIRLVSFAWFHVHSNLVFG